MKRELLTQLIMTCLLARLTASNLSAEDQSEDSLCGWIEMIDSVY